MNSILISTLAIAALAALSMLSGCSATTNSQRIAMGAASEGYVCPLTGEVLPCPECCPLTEENAKSENTDSAKAQEGFVCPINGEILPCPKCCPLND